MQNIDFSGIERLRQLSGLAPVINDLRAVIWPVFEKKEVSQLPVTSYFSIVGQFSDWLFDGRTTRSSPTSFTDEEIRNGRNITVSNLYHTIKSLAVEQEPDTPAQAERKRGVYDPEDCLAFLTKDQQMSHIGDAR